MCPGTQRRRTQSPWFPGPVPASALQVSDRQNSDPTWTFLTSPAPHYPQKYLQPTPNLNTGLPPPTVPPSPQEYPLIARSTSTGPRPPRARKESYSFSSMKELLQEGNRPLRAGSPVCRNCNPPRAGRSPPQLPMQSSCCFLPMNQPASPWH